MTISIVCRPLVQQGGHVEVIRTLAKFDRKLLEAPTQVEGVRSLTPLMVACETWELEAVKCTSNKTKPFFPPSTSSSIHVQACLSWALIRPRSATGVLPRSL